MKREYNFDPMTGKPLAPGAMPGCINKKKKIPWLAIIISCLAICVIGIVIIFTAIIKSGILLPTSDKILLAVKNTVDDKTELEKDIDITDILNSGVYTVNLSAGDDSAYGDIKYVSGRKRKQVSANMNFNDDFSMAARIDVDDENIKVCLPLEDNITYAYQYMNDSLEGENADKFYSMINDSKTMADIKEDIQEAYIQEFRQLEFEKMPEKLHMIDDKTQKCKGYKTIITSDNIQNVKESIKNIEVNGDTLENTLDAVDLDIELLMEYLGLYEDSFTDNMIVETYIYKNKLASVLIYADDENLQVLFEGGDTRTQNMRVMHFKNGYKYCMFAREGSVDGKFQEDIIRIYDGDTTIYSNYDSGSGNINLSVDNYNYEPYTISGSIIHRYKGVDINIGNISNMENIYGTYITCSIKKGADWEKTTGEEKTINTPEQINSMLGDVIGDYLEELFWYNY